MRTTLGRRYGAPSISPLVQLQFGLTCSQFLASHLSYWSVPTLCPNEACKPKTSVTVGSCICTGALGSAQFRLIRINSLGRQVCFTRFDGGVLGTPRIMQCGACVFPSLRRRPLLDNPTHPLPRSEHIE